MIQTITRLLQHYRAERKFAPDDLERISGTLHTYQRERRRQGGK
jgi:hypothetical protein